MVEFSFIEHRIVRSFSNSIRYQMVKNMVNMDEMYQTADWKTEKHVPVLSIEGKVEKGEWITVSAQVGKEVGHPNKTEHHIRWIKLFFKPKGEKYPYEIGQTNFNAHGASVK